MFSRRATFALTLMPVLISGRAYAHRIRISETDIRVDDTGGAEITHAFHADDMQRALRKAGIIDTPDLLRLRASAQAALYVSETFSITPADEINIVGAELLGDTFYVYQQCRLTGPMQDWRVQASMLHGLLPEQKCAVNLHYKGEIYSLAFIKGDEAKKILA